MSILDKYTLVWKKSDIEERYQCNACGVHTSLVHGEDGLAEWHAHHPSCEDHHAEIPTEEVEVTEPVIEETAPPPADPEPTGDDEEEEEEEEEVELTREELEAMTKKKIIEEYAPDFEGTKAELIDFLLSEDDEEGD